MADQPLDADAQKKIMQERMAKARETRMKNLEAKKASATERVPAPDTDTPDPEKAELRAKAEQAEAEAKAMEEALARSEQLRREAEAAVQQTVPSPVVVVAPPMLPRNMRVERSGNVSTQYSVRWPQIRGGTCEFCGVLDPNVPAQYQYKLCPHFRGMAARCTYCPETKDPDEIVYHSNLNVATHPDDPQTIIMWCNATACSEAHIKRFNRANSF